LANTYVDKLLFDLAKDRGDYLDMLVHSDEQKALELAGKMTVDELKAKLGQPDEGLEASSLFIPYVYYAGNRTLLVYSSIDGIYRALVYDGVCDMRGETADGSAAKIVYVVELASE